MERPQSSSSPHLCVQMTSVSMYFSGFLLIFLFFKATDDGSKLDGHKIDDRYVKRLNWQIKVVNEKMCTTFLEANDLAAI